MKKFLLSLAATVITSVCVAQDVLLSASAHAPEGVKTVDIGGVYWANMNVGATSVAGSPSTCFGDYFAWSETEPRYIDMQISGASSASFSGWKEEHSEGYSYDDQPLYAEYYLDDEHDAATQNWGKEWCTPSRGDFKALTSACGGWNSGDDFGELGTANPEGGIYWISSYQTLLPEYSGVSGLLFVDKADPTKRVFFPATGYISGTDFRNYMGQAWVGNYWSSSVYSSNPSARTEMYFTYHWNLKRLYSNHPSGQHAGFTIRPVLKEAPTSIEMVSNGCVISKPTKRIKANGQYEIIRGKNIYNSLGQLIK